MIQTKWFFGLFLLPLLLFARAPKIPEKLIICGVCKNVEKHLAATIISMESLGKCFQDYRVFIYENNSADNSAAILSQWAKRNPKVKVTSEVIEKEELLKYVKAVTYDNLPFRTEVIARARNIVFAQAMAAEFDDYAYIVMVDMDFSQKWNLTGVLTSFFIKEDWDAIFANGIDEQGYYYDRYAFRNFQYPVGPEFLGEAWWKEIKEQKIKFDHQSSLIPVYSAFGGLGIYKRSAVKGCSYSGVVNSDLEDFVKQYVSKTQAEIHSQINSGGYGEPVCCEHVTFHASMIKNGHGNLFINPKMIMSYR